MMKFRLIFPKSSFSPSQLLARFHRNPFIPIPSHSPLCRTSLCSTSLPTRPFSILVTATDPSRLADDLIIAIHGGDLQAASKLYDQYTHMAHHFHIPSVLTQLAVALAETYDPLWLHKAYRMMLDSSFDKTSMFYLSYVLARCGMPVEAGNVLRRLLEADHYPNVKLWIAILAHVCQTEQGSFLAAELVGEFAYRFNDNRVDPRKKANKPLLSMKPNAQAFNMVLTACLLSGLTKKAEDMLEWMPRIGLKPDADLLIVMAHVYERNGRLIEIKKLNKGYRCDIVKI